MEDDWGEKEDDIKEVEGAEKPLEKRSQTRKVRGVDSGDRDQTSPPAPPQYPLVGDQPDRQVSKDGNTDPPRRSNCAEGV